MKTIDKHMLLYKRFLPGITRHQKGMTLVEVMTVLVIIALLAIFAAPEVTSWKPKMNLKAASEELFSNMQLAKTHAVKNNVNVVFSFTLGAPCPGGSYKFDEVVAGGTNFLTVAMADEVCLSASTFAAGEGFSSRGLPINSTGGKVTVTSTNAKIAGKKFEITQKIAGGISLD